MSLGHHYCNYFNPMRPCEHHKLLHTLRVSRNVFQETPLSCPAAGSPPAHFGLAFQTRARSGLDGLRYVKDV